MPIAAPPARNPAGRAARRSTTGSVAGTRARLDRHQGASGQLLEPGRLGQAVDEVERLDRLAGRALDEVVLDTDGDDPPGPLVEADVDVDLVAAGRVLGRRRAAPRPSRTARRRRPSAYRASSSAWVTGRVGRTWPADRMPRVIGMRWGRKSTPMTPGVGARVLPGGRTDAGQLLLDLGDVAMAAQAVCRHALVDLAEHQVGLGLAAGTRHAGLGIDHEVADEPGPGERGEGQERRGRIAAGRADDGDRRIDEGHELGAMQLRQAVHGRVEELRVRVLEAVPARVVGRRRAAGSRGPGR